MTMGLAPNPGRWNSISVCKSVQSCYSLPLGPYSQGQTKCHKINVPIDFHVFSCLLEIIFWHFCTTDNTYFGIAAMLEQLCKQYICFISDFHLIIKLHGFEFYVGDLGHIFRDVAINLSRKVTLSKCMLSLTRYIFTPVVW